MKNFCLCEGWAHECGGPGPSDGKLVCGSHYGDLALYLEQIADLTHRCAEIADASDWRMTEPLFDIHYPDPRPMLDCLADVAAEIIDVTGDNVFFPDWLACVRRVGYSEFKKDSRYLFAITRCIMEMAAFGPLVDCVARQPAVKKLLMGDWSILEGGERFVGLPEIYLLVHRMFPLDLVSDMYDDTYPCVACGWRSSLDVYTQYPGGSRRCLNRYCVYADLQAIEDRVRALHTFPRGYTLPYDGYR